MTFDVGGINPFTLTVPSPKNKQHRSKVLLNSFPVSGQGFFHRIKT